MAKEIVKFTTAQETKIKKTATDVFVLGDKFSTARSKAITAMFLVLGVVKNETGRTEIDGPKWEALQTLYSEASILLSRNTLENEKRMFSKTCKLIGFEKFQTPENRARAEARKADKANAPKKATAQAKTTARADMLIAALKGIKNAATGQGSDVEKLAEVIRIAEIALAEPVLVKAA